MELEPALWAGSDVPYWCSIQAFQIKKAMTAIMKTALAMSPATVTLPL